MFYVIALDELSYVEVKAALAKLSQTAKFFPTVAEIYEAARSIRATAEDNGELDAGQAWEEAMRLVKTCHVYKPWTFSNPDVEQAVKQFGKQELCALGAADVNTARAQFRRIYNDVVSRRKDREENEKVLTRLGIRMDTQLSGAAKLKLVGSGKQ